ncbi:MAG: hypothetical protein J5921_03800 [Clostridia bacterium]|nr:hypothetical protein [Clostridia bacterium]
MNLEFLVVGIARGNKEDFDNFYNETRRSAFAYALVLTGDRILAREAAAESYRRVVSEAKHFDTTMSARMWHLEMLRNLCLNGMADGEISRQAEAKRRENLSRILTAALFETSEDRGTIIGVRKCAGLTKSETARLLWYNPVSCSGEYTRGIREAAAICGFDKGEDKKSFREIEDMIEHDFNECVPDFLELAKGGRNTAFSNINCTMLLAGESEKALPGESQEERQKRMAEKTVKAKRRKVIIAAAVIGVLAVALAVTLLVVFLGKSGGNKGDDPAEVKEPQYRTQVECVIYGDSIFYSNYADNGALFVYSMSTSSSRKLSDAVPKDFSNFDGNTCYFRNSSAGEIWSLNAETFEAKAIQGEYAYDSAEEGEPSTYTANVYGALPFIYNGELFYSSKTGVSKLSDGKVTDIFVDNTGSCLRCCLTVIGGTVYFSSGPSDGFHSLTPNDLGDYYKEDTLGGTVIYDFGVAGKKIAFDDGEGSLYVIDLESGKLLPMLKAVLLSGAFCVDGDAIYFYGVGNDGSHGIFKITLADLESEKLPTVVVPFDVFPPTLSDIYVSDGTILLYYSTGEKTNAYNELVIVKEDGTAETVFKVSSKAAG